MAEAPLSPDGTRILAPGHERHLLARVARCGRFDELQSSTGSKAQCDCGVWIPLRVREPGEGRKDKE